MAAKKEEQKMSKDEQIGFHKGSLSVLAKEREEFVKLLQVVEQLMYAHLDALKKLGVDLQQQAGDMMKDVKHSDSKSAKKPKKSIEEVIR